MTSTSLKNLNEAPLGKKSTYIAQYQPDLLFPIPREAKRAEIGIEGEVLPFHGVDIWNAYELSWLNSQGKPEIAAAEIFVPCQSSHLIESKSLKLYFNSFNNTRFSDWDSVKQVIAQDLSKAASAPVAINLLPMSKATDKIYNHFNGTSLDGLDVSCDTYQPQPDYLVTEEEVVTETLFSDLLKSNCLVTGQPDWASVQIAYTGSRINHAGLLKYLISFRNHDEFHEQCVERIFMDISRRCRPEKLLVYARYTRRGGIDINPYRANYPVSMDNVRLWRQ